MSSNHNEKCVCNICNCGRHRCKLHPARTVRAGTGGPCSFSEYTQQFKQHALQPVTSFKPAANPAHGDGPLSDKTTNRVDFVSHPLERPQFHQPEQYRPTSGAFDDTTMYKKEFTEKRGERAGLIKREPRRGAAGEFQGEPTYTRDYRKWDLPDRRTAHPPDAQWQPSLDAFAGVPTYQTDYVPYATARPPASFKPSEAAKGSQSPLDDVTDYRQSYVPHQLERRQAKEKTNYSRPAVPFEGVTTFARDFTPKAGGMRGSLKPSAQAYASNAPFAGDTTNKLDYKTWELSRPFVHQADRYMPPEGAIDGVTSYGTDFPAHPLVRESYKKRADRGQPSGPFEDATENKDNYRRWEAGTRVRAGPNQLYQPNQAPFEGQSTAAAHFVPHPVDARRSFKPSQGAAKTDEPFDGTTLYRLEYVAKHAEPCPASQLTNAASGYKFQGSDERGHQLYAREGGASAAGGTTTVTDLKSGQLVTVK